MGMLSDMVYNAVMQYSIGTPCYLRTYAINPSADNTNEEMGVYRVAPVPTDVLLSPTPITRKIKDSGNVDQSDEKIQDAIEFTFFYNNTFSASVIAAAHAVVVGGTLDEFEPPPVPLPDPPPPPDSPDHVDGGAVYTLRHDLAQPIFLDDSTAVGVRIPGYLHK